jgi:hypothetical protein
VDAKATFRIAWWEEEKARRRERDAWVKGRSERGVHVVEPADGSQIEFCVFCS